MANKAFEIQNASLRIGGVELQAGTTGVVIPGVTQAANFRVEEVEDVDDQTYQFAPDSEVVVIDAALYATIIADGNVTTFADFTATTDEDGEIDEIRVNGRGTYTQSNAGIASTNDMYAYIGEGSASDRPLVPQDWIQIPFRPKMRAGEVENIGGGGDLGDFSIDGNTLEADSMTIRTVDDDMTIESDSDIFISVRDNGNVNISDQEGNTFKFEPTTGKITFPNNSEQTTAYTGESDLAPLLTKTPGNNLELNAEIIMTQDLQGAIAVATGDYNFDVEFNAATGDAMGNTYAVGQADGARFIMAFNPDSTLKWAKEVAGDADFESSATLQNIRYDGENNEILVGYNCASHTGIARVNPADGSIISSQRIIPANPAEILSQSVFVQDNNGVFVGGEAVGERTEYLAVTARAGTNATGQLVVNWADVGSPAFVEPFNTNRWFIDTLGNGLSYSSPFTVCQIQGLQPSIYPPGSGAGSLTTYSQANGDWIDSSIPFAFYASSGLLGYPFGGTIAGSLAANLSSLVGKTITFDVPAGGGNPGFTVTTTVASTSNGDFNKGLILDIQPGWLGDGSVSSFTIQGETSGLTVSVSYGRDDERTQPSKWYYNGVTMTNPGSGYTTGDLLRIPGSQLDGVDSDFIFVPGGSYTVETVGSDTVITFVTANYTNMELLNVTDFKMWGKSIYGSPQGPWDLTPGYTVTRDETNTYLTAVGVPDFPISGDLLFVDLVNGNDIWGIYAFGGFNYFNYQGAPSLMKIRFQMNSVVDFTTSSTWNIQASLSSQAFITKTFGADPLAGEYSVANGDLVDSPYFQFVPMSDPPMITGGMGGSWGGRLAANIDDLVGKTIAITITDFDGVSNPEIVITTIVGHTTSPGYSIQLGPEAINAIQVVRRVDSFIIEGTVGWSRTLGDTGFQKTHSIATSIARNEIYMLVEDGSKVDRVNLLVLDYDTGQLLRQRSISNGNARGGEPGTVLSSGNFVYVVGTDDSDRALVTKLDMANEGALVWQRRHNDGGGRWDGRPVAAFASDGNIIVAGVYYEDIDENDDVLGFWKLNAETGALMFKTYVVDRQEDDDFFEYAEAQCQPFSIVNGYIYYGAFSDDDENDYNIGVAVKIKDDGTGFGQYGRWEYMANPDSFDWVDNTSNAQIVDRGLTFVDELSITIETANIVLAGDLSANRNIVYQSELIGRPAPKITFPDESELTTAGIGRHGTDNGGNTFTLSSAMNGKFIYFNSPFNGAPSTIIVPPNTTTPLPIGFTVTLAVGEFGGQPIYVNNDSINAGPSAATLYASGSASFGVNAWQLAGDGKTGLYTIMKIDTNTWMIAGPNVQVD